MRLIVLVTASLKLLLLTVQFLLLSPRRITRTLHQIPRHVTGALAPDAKAARVDPLIDPLSSL